MEINSFNELFACAKEHGAYLDSFYQDADGQFAASWRAGPRIPGERRCPHAKRVHPFNAARDALLTLIETAPKTFMGVPVVLDSTIGSDTIEIRGPRNTVAITNLAPPEEDLFG